MITIDNIKERLLSLGYETTDNDTFALGFLQTKEENYVKHFCNIKEIPECLDQVIIDKICGEFLSQKKATGSSSTDGGTNTMGASGVVKKIQDGDTTVEFEVSSNITFNTVVKDLTKSYEEELIRHRKICW